MPDREPSRNEKRGFIADSLATGLMVMLAMTVIQRGFGFIRSIWFCRLLDDSDVGSWAMAFGFITLITPIMLLGLPGSLPRYAEHFRSRGHLTALVRRLAIWTMLCAAGFLAAVTMFPEWFGWLIFLEPSNRGLVQAVGWAVLAIIVFYFVNELVTALRLVRVSSLMQFVQSVSFTVVGIAWLTAGGGLEGLIGVFAGCTLLAVLPAAIVLRRGWRDLPDQQKHFDSAKMWRRVLPYASALWAMNLLDNAFALSDRYMILHFTPGGEAMGQAAVGQYHCGRILPVLFMSLASMVSGVLLPYLSADWEAGRRRNVRERLHGCLIGISALFTVGGAVALLIAPTLFETLLQSRYASGLSIMPMAFTFCIWSALVTIGQNYLWVAERGKWVALATGVGLVSNLALNALLLPIWGLHGAVVATLVANGVVMLGLWIAMSRFGYSFDHSIVFVSLWPATLMAGPWIAIACLLGTLLTSREIQRVALSAARHERVEKLLRRWSPRPISTASLS